MCILQLTGAKAHDKVKKHKKELAIVAITEMCILGKNERIILLNILVFLADGE